MNSTIKHFEFDVTKVSPDEEGVNSGAVAHITVDEWIEHDGTLRISTALKTVDEIDAYVEGLKANLDAVARRAKAALKNKQKAIREEIEEQNALKEIDDHIVIRKSP